MLVFNISDFSQNAKDIFNAALNDDVIINNDEGKQYIILPINSINDINKSPLEDIPRIKLNLSTQDIVEILHECRAGL